MFSLSLVLAACLIGIDLGDPAARPRPTPPPLPAPIPPRPEPAPAPVPIPDLGPLLAEVAALRADVANMPRPGGDNGPLLAEVAQLRHEVATLRESAAGNQRLTSELAGLRRDLASAESSMMQAERSLLRPGAGRMRSSSFDRENGLVRPASRTTETVTVPRLQFTSAAPNAPIAAWGQQPMPLQYQQVPVYQAAPAYSYGGGSCVGGVCR
jgi:hypothetical protein